MVDIPGFTIIEELHRNYKTVVYRAVSEKKLQPVILKVLSAEYPSQEDLMRLNREFEIIKSLQIDGVGRPGSVR